MPKEKNGKQPKEETIDRHYDSEGRDKFKSKGKGIPGRETY